MIRRLTSSPNPAPPVAPGSATRSSAGSSWAPTPSRPGTTTPTTAAPRKCAPWSSATSRRRSTRRTSWCRRPLPPPPSSWGRSWTTRWRCTSTTSRPSRRTWPASRASPCRPVLTRVCRWGSRCSHRQTLVKTGRQGEARDAGQVRRDGRDVVEVHRHRVVQLLPQLEGGGGSRRRHQDVRLVERRREVALDQGAHLLGVAVVRVVVPGREGVGAQDNPALDLVAEPGATGGAHHALGGHRAVARFHPSDGPVT